MNDPQVIKWLESPAGQVWSRQRHNHNGYLWNLVSVREFDRREDAEVTVCLLWHNEGSEENNAQAV